MKVRIATRGSRLAIWQTLWVKEQLERQMQPGQFSFEPLIVSTVGDQTQNQSHMPTTPGVFVKELENTLMENKAEMAVHSLKDMPSRLAPGMSLASYLARVASNDLVIGGTLEMAQKVRAVLVGDKPATDVIGIRVGTSSPRRAALVLNRAPSVKLLPLRGNVETRLEKLRRGEYDAIVLARAGLARLNLVPETALDLPLDKFVPAPSQGVVAVEVFHSHRPELASLVQLLRSINHRPSEITSIAERSFMAHLNAGCQTPVAVLAEIKPQALSVGGVVCSVDGKRLLKSNLEQPLPSLLDVSAEQTAHQIGSDLAGELIKLGANDLLQ